MNQEWIETDISKYVNILTDVFTCNSITDLDKICPMKKVSANKMYKKFSKEETIGLIRERYEMRYISYVNLSYANWENFAFFRNQLLNGI